MMESLKMTIGLDKALTLLLMAINILVPLLMERKMEWE